MKLSKIPKSTVDVHQLSSFLRGVELLNGLSSDDLLRVAQMCQLTRFRRAERIFTEAQPGACLYVVMSGRVKIFGSSTQGRSKTFAYLEPGDFFGEIALIANIPRTATVRAIEDCHLLVIGENDFWSILSENLGLAMFIEAVGQVRMAK